MPWDEHQHLLEDTFRNEIQHFLGAGFNHLYIFGTAGEGYAVDTQTFKAIAEIFYAETHPNGTVAQLGIIGLSTANIIERIRLGYEIGFRDFQISMPCWKPLSDTELLRFFVDVCGTFPDGRFLHYNLLRAGRLLTPADYRRLVDEVPNLVATKNTCTTVPSTVALMRQAPELQHFLSEAMFPIGCLFGECSMLSSFGPLMPTKTRQLFEYGRTRQLDKLFELHGQYLEVIDDVLSPLSRRDLIDGAYDKVIVRLAGIDMPLRLLSPYESFSDGDCENCRSILRERHGGWTA